MAALHELTATEASVMIEAGEISSEELVVACLARIRAREDTVRAWQYLDEDAAIAEARKADGSPRRGPLHGIPFAVKDIIDTADAPTAHGSPIYEGHRPTEDAACVTAMRDAGAVMMGKTVTTEFATFHPGKTRNPHDPTHTPGGSSSGSGAAVGDMMVPLAFGSQTAGSLIRPAAFCGAHGLKPSFGTVDMTGIKPLDPGLDHLGYMARGVDDLALYYDTVRGATPKPAADGLGRAPRIGICRTHHWDLAQPETVTAVEDAAARFAALGAEVSDAALPDDFADLVPTLQTLLNVGLTESLGREWKEHRDQISDRLAEMIQAGLDCPKEDFLAALAHADDCRAQINGVFGDCDVFLAPSAPGEAPEGLEATGNPVFQVPWTLLRVPCVTVPFATGPGGLPVGIQFIGRQGDDDTVLAVAKWFDTRK